MFLALDIGNSALKGAFFSGNEVAHAFRVPNDGERAVQSAVQTLEEQLALRSVTGVGLASVVPAWTGPIADAVARLAGAAPTIVRAGMSLPFRLAYETPNTLGGDRIAAASAGWLIYGAGEAPRSVVVVDAGTAVTYEVIERGGVYQGGAISPGPVLAHVALSRGTAQLPAVPVEVPEHVVGRSTREAIQSGIVYGFLDGVAGMLGRIRETLPDEPVVVATGGWSALLLSHTASIDHVDPYLVLRGVQLLAVGERALSPGSVNRRKGLERRSL